MTASPRIAGYCWEPSAPGRRHGGENARLALPEHVRAQLNKLKQGLGEAVAASTVGLDHRTFRRAAAGALMNQTTRDLVLKSPWIIP